MVSNCHIPNPYDAVKIAPKIWIVLTRTLSLSLNMLTPTNKMISSTVRPMTIKILPARKDVFPPIYLESVWDNRSG